MPPRPHNPRGTRQCAWLLGLAVGLVACSGGWEAYEPLPGALPDDTEEGVPYPAGPYGMRVGDTIADIVFEEALMDPETFCKGARDLDLTQTDGVRSLSLTDIYRGDPLCPGKKKEFLWLVSSAGWCTACQAELEELGRDLSQSGIDDRILIVNAVSETTTEDDPATPGFVWSMAQEYGLNFPQAADPDRTLHEYADSFVISLPFQLGIDLRSMTIIYLDGGTVTTAEIERLALETLGES